MNSRAFDIIIYGANGVAGKHVVKHFLRNHPDIKLAIAGRTKSKLEQLASDLNSISTILPNQLLIAPSNDKEQLIHILSQAKICLSCAGPYRHVGPNIVEACIEAQTDYLDLCGEPQFFDDMLTSFDAKAQERNVLVISSCAFDCVPAEMSYQFASKELLKKYTTQNISVTNVEIVHTFQDIKRVNATTFHAAVDGFHAAYTGELKASRKKVKECFPQLEQIEAQKRPSTWKKFISFPSMTSPLYHEFTNHYILKFMGADASCILSSDRYLRLRSCSEEEQASKPYLSVCFGLAQKSHAYTFLGFGAVFATLAKWSWGCKLLHSNPELFTNGFFTPGGPTDDELKDGKFATYCTAYGLTKDQICRVKFSGGEPGYIATSAMMCALALTVLRNRDSMKFGGGVLLPGAAFKDCDEVYVNLKKEGLQLEVLSENHIPLANDEKV